VKRLLCVLVLVCLFLVGFTVGRYPAVIYLADNESIYVSRYLGRMYVWVYTFDEITGVYKIERALENSLTFNGVDIHFVEPRY